MAYIGKEPAVGNFVKLDAISTSSTNTYNLTLDSVAFTPESANHMLVSLNGVIQAPLTSFSVSGSTITFLPSSGTLSSSDSIDFIMVYGNVLDIGTPSDSTVTNAKTNFVSTSSNAGLQIKGDGTTDGTLQLNCRVNSHGIKLKSPPHSAGQSYTLTFPSGNVTAGKFLKVDSVSGSGTTGVGTMTFADAGGGQWTHILTSTASSSTSITFTSTYITTTYLDYMIVFSGLKLSSDDSHHRLFFSTDNGSSYSPNGQHQNARMGVNTAGNAVNSGQTGSSAMYMTSSQGIGNSTGEGVSGHVIIFDPLKQSGTTDMHTRMLSHSTYDDTGGNPVIVTTANKWTSTTAVNNIKLDLLSGNITSGKVSLYGRKIS